MKSQELEYATKLTPVEKAARVSISLATMLFYGTLVYIDLDRAHTINILFAALFFIGPIYMWAVTTMFCLNVMRPDSYRI